MANAQMDHLYYRIMQPAKQCAVNSFFISSFRISLVAQSALVLRRLIWLIRK